MESNYRDGPTGHKKDCSGGAPAESLGSNTFNLLDYLFFYIGDMGLYASLSDVELYILSILQYSLISDLTLRHIIIIM